jgi:hypothetical protein
MSMASDNSHFSRTEGKIKRKLPWNNHAQL